MLASKPFVGFHAVKTIKEGTSPRIYVKAFTKRKQEYIEDGEFDVSTLQKRLANPSLTLSVLFSVLLNTLFPSVFKKQQRVTASFLSGIYLNLFPPLHRYLLAGKLVI